MRPGRLFAWGLGLWALLAAQLVLLRFLDEPLARAVVVGMTAEIFTGREVGIPLALDQGAMPWLVAQVSLTQDIASALLFYPAFLWALQHYHDADTVIMRRVRKIEAAAERHQHYVHRWGPLGLAAFMLVPFLINGPLVGLLLGRLGGMRTANILVPVVAATAIAAVAWTFFFDIMIGLGSKVHPWAGRIITAAMLGLVVGLVVVDWIRDKRRHETASK